MRYLLPGWQKEERAKNMLITAMRLSSDKGGRVGRANIGGSRVRTTTSGVMQEAQCQSKFFIKLILYLLLENGIAHTRYPLLLDVGPEEALMHIHFAQLLLHVIYLGLYILDLVLGSVVIDLKVGFLVGYLDPFLYCIDLLDHFEVDLVEPCKLALEILSLDTRLFYD